MTAGRAKGVEGSVPPLPCSLAQPEHTHTQRLPFLLRRGWCPWSQRRHLLPQSAFRLANESVSVTSLSFQSPQEESGIRLHTVVQALLIHNEACSNRMPGVGARCSLNYSSRRRESRALGRVQPGGSTPSSHAGSCPQPIGLVASCAHLDFLQ